MSDIVVSIYVPKKHLSENEAFYSLCQNRTKWFPEIFFYSAITALARDLSENGDNLSMELKQLCGVLVLSRPEFKRIIKNLKYLEAAYVSVDSSRTGRKTIITLSDTLNEDKMQSAVQKGQKELFPNQKTESKKKYKESKGYYASDYSDGGERSNAKAKTDFQELIQYYMRELYDRHNIDYFIPKSNIPKYYKRAKDVIEHLDSLENAKNYVDWFLNENSFGSSGYSLDLFVSTSVLNRYISADIRDKNQAQTEEMPNEDEILGRDIEGIII